MNRFEDRVHTARRDGGRAERRALRRAAGRPRRPSCSATRSRSPTGYRSWWSYVPHFIGSPGYVYAYAYGQLLALSVYGRYLEEGESFVPRYLEMLAAGGSRSPEELAPIAGLDLTDPGFWDDGLELVRAQLERGRAGGRCHNGRVTEHSAHAPRRRPAGCRPRRPPDPAARGARVSGGVLLVLACAGGQVQGRPAPAPEAEDPHDLGLDARVDRGLQPHLGLDVRARASSSCSSSTSWGTSSSCAARGSRPARRSSSRSSARRSGPSPWATTRPPRRASAWPGRCSARWGPRRCIPVALVTDDDFWRALAFTGFFLNLFNLLPVVPLDGGRALAALAPWMWFAGLFAVVVLAFAVPNPIILLIALLAAYETWRRWRSAAAVGDARVLRGHAAPAPGDRRRVPRPDRAARARDGRDVRRANVRRRLALRPGVLGCRQVGCSHRGEDGGRSPFTRSRRLNAPLPAV